MNRKKVKLSYRCLPNLKTQISKHNSKILNQAEQRTPPHCNCNVPSKCPLPTKCTTDNLVYQATVTADGKEEYYVGLTARTFKARHGEHQGDFRDFDRRTNSRLATHVWDLKCQGKIPKVDFKVVCRASPFNPISGVCNLCTAEKWNIIYKPETASLNHRHELFNHCRHKQKILLAKKKKKRKRNQNLPQPNQQLIL